MTSSRRFHAILALPLVMAGLASIPGGLEAMGEPGSPPSPMPPRPPEPPREPPRRREPRPDPDLEAVAEEARRRPTHGMREAARRRRQAKRLTKRTTKNGGSHG